MTTALTPDGLVTDTQAEIQAAFEADQRAEISTSLDLSTSSPLGQLNRIKARALRVIVEALAALANALDPDTASGDALFRIGAITGTIREPATATRVAAVCDLNEGVYAIGLLTAFPLGRPSDTFSNLEAVTSLGGDTDVLFGATATGPIQVAANSLQIAAAVAGWNGITSNAAGDPGAAIETEAAFRQRRNEEVEAPGSSSLDGIRADLTRNIPLIESATIVENTTDAVVDSIPPGSFEAIVYGPASPTSQDNQDVADQIFASKAATAGTYGNTSKTVTDSEGYGHVIKFTRPVDVPVDLDVTLATRPGYAGDAAVLAAITAGAAVAWVPGVDADWSDVVAWVKSVVGVLRVSVVLVDTDPFGTTTINTRQRATLGTVVITSAPEAP